MKREWQYSRIGKEYEFSAAHRLTKVPESHPCFRLHGHNYKVEIEVRGDVMEKTDFCLNLDFKDLDKVVSPLINMLDHQYLNDIIENPTAEKIAQWFIDNLAPTYVYSVKVWETPKCWAMAINADGLYHAVHKE